MPIDLRRCAQAAAHAALAEAFAPPPQSPRRRARRRLRPVRAVLLGAGLVTTARVALDPQRRRELFEALARRFPIQELLDEIALEADVVQDSDEATATEPGPDTDAEAEAANAQSAKKPAAARQRSLKTPKTPAAGQQRRRPVRARGDSNGQSKHEPPKRGTRA